jgi:hypothetical protein
MHIPMGKTATFPGWRKCYCRYQFGCHWMDSGYHGCSHWPRWRSCCKLSPRFITECRPFYLLTLSRTHLFSYSPILFHPSISPILFHRSSFTYPLSPILFQYKRGAIGLAITSIYVLDFAINCGKTLISANSVFGSSIHASLCEFC